MHTSASYKLKLKLHNLQHKVKLVDNIKQIQFLQLAFISFKLFAFQPENPHQMWETRPLGQA